MAYRLRLPDLGEGVAEGEIRRWLVEVGQHVEEDDPLLEVQTDKAAVEIPSPASGVVSRILVDEGDVVPVGELLVVIGEEDGEPVAAAAAPTPAAAPPPAAPHDGGRVRATPLVRRLASELGVDLSGVSGSGPGGRITEEDVRAAAEGGGRPGERRVPLRGVRRLIAEHLGRAQREVPSVTVVEECDFEPLGRVRGERSYLPFLLRATAAALREHPHLNATLEGDELVLHERIDIGVAVQTDEGLVVPVVRGVEGRSLDDLSAELERLAEGARSGGLSAAELRGSTFSLTSAGRLAGLFATPLVNVPEVAILGLHRIASRPVVRDGRIVIGEVGWLSCTFDHRALDGALASAFLLDVIARLQSPDGLLDR